ncbi:MAG: hypothetical protein ACXABO_21215 [Promethearchaeota archaeon]|jgi:hypothetical protein
MSKKKPKHSFSKEEKELIQGMKNELRSMGIPRDQWGVYIQKELRMRQKSKGISRSKFMNKVKEGFGKVVGKVASKKLGNFKDQLEEFEDLFKHGSQDEMDLINMMFSDVKFNNINALGKDGASLKKISQEKKKVVDLDFLDDDE